MGRGFKRTVVVFRTNDKGVLERFEITPEEHKARTPKKIPYANGLASLSAGAATKREAAAKAKEYAAAGLRGVSFDHKNDLVFASRQARRAWCEYAGKVDFDGGYGDRT